MGKVGRELISVWIKLQENLRRPTAYRKLTQGEPGAERKTTLLVMTTKDRMRFMTMMVYQIPSLQSSVSL